MTTTEPDRRTDGERRTTESAVWLDMRHSTRRVSPAVGEHAIQECARLRDALTASEALLADCRDSLTSAREECARLHELVNASFSFSKYSAAIHFDEPRQPIDEWMNGRA